MNSILLYTDPGKDLDDEQALLFAAQLHKEQSITLAAVIANLHPTPQRAQLAKGTLQQLNLDISVGIGMQQIARDAVHDYEFDVPYLANIAHCKVGNTLAVRTLEKAAPQSIDIVLNSTVTDIAWLLMNHRQLCTEKINSITAMSKVQVDIAGFPLKQRVPNGSEYLQPADAANNAFDWSSALYTYHAIQELRIPFTVLSSHAAFAAKFNCNTYQQMADSNHIVGQSISRRAQAAMQSQWQAVNAPEGSTERGSLPSTRTREFFVNIYCNGIDPGIKKDEQIWPYIQGYNQYDALSFLAAIPTFRDEFFTSHIETVEGVNHRLIGVNESITGIKNADALREFILEKQLAVLS